MMNFEEMSHHTGAQLIAFLRQIIELMNWLRHARRPDHKKTCTSAPSCKGVRLKRCSESLGAMGTRGNKSFSFA